VLALAFVARAAHATNFWVGPPGVSNGNGTQTSPFSTIRAGAQAAQPGDTVFIHGGTYNETVNPPRSGTSSAWITFSAAPGELPILDGNGTGGGAFGNGTAQFIRAVGIAARSWNSAGFGNGWVNNTGMSNGNWQFIDCIADNNGINGIAFRNATGLLIDESIVAHNGNQLPSWSSGVNLFHLYGDATTNIVRRTVAFENIDITTTHATPAGATDGSGFILDILDRTRGGALFENNLGFRNGGSCIRINTIGAVLVNNTCYNDGLNPIDTAPAAPGEVFFSTGNLGAVMINNLLVAGGFTNRMTAAAPGGNVPTGQSFLTEVTVNANGALPATPFFTNPAGIDFSLVAASASAEIDKGSTTDMPSTDIGFDPKCVTTDASKAAPIVGTGVSWWSYYIDYTYIAGVGGVAGCFHPAVRPQGNGPDIGAYEYGGVLADGGAGGSSSSSSSGGGSSSGSSGPAVDAGAASSSGSGSSSGGPNSGSSGRSGSSGSSSGNGSGAGASSSGSAASSGAPGSGNGSTVDPDAGDAFTAGPRAGCGCHLGGASGARARTALGLAVFGALLIRRRRQRLTD
jgi:MYXO-CTERM domain-containing protein